jgi:hypothetical protein
LVTPVDEVSERERERVGIAEATVANAAAAKRMERNESILYINECVWKSGMSKEERGKSD